MIQKIGCRRTNFTFHFFHDLRLKFVKFFAFLARFFSFYGYRFTPLRSSLRRQPHWLFLSTVSKSKWNLNVELKTGRPWETLKARTRINNKPNPHVTLVWQSNPGHNDWRRALSPLRCPCSLTFRWSWNKDWNWQKLWNLKKYKIGSKVGGMSTRTVWFR